MVALAFPLVAHERRQALRRRWSYQLFDIVNVRLEPRGQSPTSGSMLVANHISWLDIYAISAIQPAAFVSKSELRGWPLIGWLAARTGTIFLQRGSRSHARVVNEEIGRVLRSDGNVAVFPEGTTTDGTELLHFHAALLQPAINTGRPLQPLALTYRDRDGQRSSAAAYAGETTMWQSLLRLAREPGMVLIIEFLPALATENGDRRALAASARAAIAECLGLIPSSEQ